MSTCEANDFRTFSRLTREGRAIVVHACRSSSGLQCALLLQAETSWRAAAAQLEALTKTHDGVLGQLREAQDRTALAEQETIEVKPMCTPQLGCKALPPAYAHGPLNAWHGSLQKQELLLNLMSMQKMCCKCT